jgi:hypothetical protein
VAVAAAGRVGVARRVLPAAEVVVAALVVSTMAHGRILILTIFPIQCRW